MDRAPPNLRRRVAARPTSSCLDAHLIASYWQAFTWRTGSRDCHRESPRIETARLGEHEGMFSTSLLRLNRRKTIPQFGELV